MFDTFAATGAYPKASNTGNVISVPLPTTVLIVPAARPARAMASTSPTLTAQTGRVDLVQASRPRQNTPTSGRVYRFSAHRPYRRIRRHADAV